jgi:hypothetical protein
MSTRSRSPHTRRTALATVGAVAALLAGAASAHATTYPMTATPITPAVGATYAPAASSPVTVQFEFQSTGTGPSSMNIEVSRTQTLGQDGTLANDFNLAPVGGVLQRDSDHSKYVGSASVYGLTAPGTYYYQYSGTAYNMDDTTNCPGLPMYASCFMATPIFSFTIAAPQPQPAPQPQTTSPQNVTWPLSLAAAKTAARNQAIETWGARKPKVISSHRLSVSRVMVTVRWRTKAGKKCTRTLKVRRTGFGIQAFAA